ncbi:MAG TPA: serine/threonine-protein kinase [Ktedonobacteraceae bacterium]|jgi:serine/threonine protein kinase|nr:serine/threonine-protein kinase [Ktedonobacteraceae bacterium]
MLKTGQHFGRYRIDRLLEQGGMGEIYVATDTHLNRRVAIKIIRTGKFSPQLDDTLDEATRLFQREAQVLKELEHPHILPLYDSGTTTIGGLPCMYIIMPYRSEGSLAAWIGKQGGPLPLREVAHVVQQAADALQHAHDHHIIHRDVKPSNFLIIPNRRQPDLPHIQLADFGIAKFLHALSPPSLLIRGTPMYMAPEHWRGKAVPATDQYALAAMAYELLTGYPLFECDTPEQYMYHHLHQTPQSPSELNPSIPPAVDEVLLRALEKDPANRYPSIAEFAEAFRQAVSSAEAAAMTLTISRTEARRGTTRFVTLPDGYQEQVNVPPGSYNGQLIPLAEASTDETPLFIKLDVKATDEILTLPAEGQAIISNPIPETVPTVIPRHTITWGMFIPFVIATLLILSGVTFVAYSVINNQRQTELFGTATANSNLTGTSSGAVATSHAISNATTTSAAASATASASTATAVSSTATAVSSTATAVSSTETAATEAAATAIAQQTATAVAIDAYYRKFRQGTRQMEDPLQDNNMGFNWDIVDPTSGAGCAFVQSSYHVIVSQQSLWPCFANSTNFTNFSFQVAMTLNRGDRAGIVFRADTNNRSFYYFYVNSDGSYGLEIVRNLVHGPVLSHGKVPGGLRQTNYLGVIANGSTIEIFVNMQMLDTVTNTTFTQGAVGVIAEDVTSPTDASFSDAEAWTQ